MEKGKQNVSCLKNWRTGMTKWKRLLLYWKRLHSIRFGIRLPVSSGDTTTRREQIKEGNAKKRDGPLTCPQCLSIRVYPNLMWISCKERRRKEGKMLLLRISSQACPSSSFPFPSHDDRLSILLLEILTFSLRKRGYDTSSVFRMGKKKTMLERTETEKLVNNRCIIPPLISWHI